MVISISQINVPLLATRSSELKKRPVNVNGIEYRYTHLSTSGFRLKKIDRARNSSVSNERK